MGRVPHNVEQRLREVEATLQALVTGQVDSVAGERGPILLAEAQAALHASEARFRALVENSAEIIAMFDRDGRIRYVSPALERVIGRAPPEAVGAMAGIFVHPKDRKEFKRLIAKLSQTPGESAKIEIRALHADGGSRILSVVLSNHLDDPSLGVIVLNGSDVTERQLAQERYRSLLESAPDAMVVADEDGLIVLVNAEMTRMFGYGQEQVLGRPISALFREGDDQDGGFPFRPGSLGAPQRRMGSTRLVCRRKDGREFPAEISLNPVVTNGESYVTAAIRDVSERVQMESALRESEARLASTLDSIGDGVLATDQHGIVTRMNPVAESLTEWSEGEAIGRHIDQVFSIMSEDKRLPLPTPVEGLLAGASRVAAHARLVGREGTERFIAQSGAPILTSAGSAVGVVLAFRDVTAQREMEQQLRTSDRMVSIGTLAAGVAHEINNPLSALMGNLFMIEEELGQLGAEGDRGRQGEDDSASPATGPSLMTMLHDANEAAERVRQTVRDIKLFSRAEETVLTAVNVEQLLESSFRLTRNEVRHRAQLVKRFRPTPLVRANEARLGQVFVNLIINAVQAIPEGHADDNEIAVSAGVDASGRVVIEVRDSGVGMPPDVLRRIFDPFFTTKPVGVGTGLGLAICQRIINEIGGSIAVESEVGKGTTFRVSLPPYRSGAVVPLPRKPELPTAVKRRARVLLIDDEPLVRTAVERALAKTHDVVSETRGQDALARIAEGAFDVILCDVMMPQMTGIEFYERVAKISSRQAERIVFVTGGVFSGAAARFIESTRNPVIEKPLDNRLLRALVAKFSKLEPEPVSA